MRNVAGLIILLLLVQLTEAQNNTSNLEQTIKAGKAKNIKALIHITGGVLKISSGIDDLANVKLNYDKDDWTPTVSYTENDDLGKLIVKASSVGDEKHIDDDNNCTVLLNNDYNYSLGVVLGAGVANMNFENFHIEKALFKLGVGSFKINMANVSLPFLKIEAGIGEASLDLSGDYKNDLKGQIDAGIGELKIFVPSNIGVKFIVTGFLGDVQAEGYKKNGDEYTNTFYGETKHSIVIKINGAIGTIKVKEK